MRFWIECTRFGTQHIYYVNISLVGGMWRDGERTILEFVGGNIQNVEVNEPPDQILAANFSSAAMSDP